MTTDKLFSTQNHDRMIQLCEMIESAQAEQRMLLKNALLEVIFPSLSWKLHTMKSSSDHFYVRSTSMDCEFIDRIELFKYTYITGNNFLWDGQINCTINKCVIFDSYDKSRLQNFCKDYNIQYEMGRIDTTY